MSNLNTMLNKYATQEVKTKVQGDKNPHRVALGNVFMQPTGGKGTKPFNFSYAYFGMSDKAGKFLGGFSMSNMSMLQAVETGLLSKDFAKLFEAYAELHVASGETVLKLKA